MSDTVTVSVIHNCKRCKDEGVLILNRKEIVHCDLCLAVACDHDAKSWFEIKEDGTLGVKAGIHLEKPFGMPWQEKKFN
jgi:hypothetical protein